MFQEMMINEMMAVDGGFYPQSEKRGKSIMSDKAAKNVAAAITITACKQPAVRAVLGVSGLISRIYSK